MAIILVKIDTVAKTTETLYEPNDLSEVAKFSPEYIITFVCQHFSIESLKNNKRGIYAQAKIIASVLLEELLSLPNSTICKMVGYSSKSNSSNVVSKNKKQILINKDVILYPMYSQLKAKLWRTLVN